MNLIFTIIDINFYEFYLINQFYVIIKYFKLYSQKFYFLILQKILEYILTLFKINLLIVIINSNKAN